MVSLLRLKLAMENFAKYFLVTTPTVALFLVGLYLRLSCHLHHLLWFAAFIFCMIAQIYTFVVAYELKFLEKLPASVFEGGFIDREKTTQIRRQKDQERLRAYYEKAQRNCTSCKGSCRHCNRPLRPLSQ